MARGRETLKLGYQHQNSALTLAEGLAQYYEANEGRVTRPENLCAESAALFLGHDQCHVIFGLGTTLADETLADVRTLLSCDVGHRRYLRYLRTDTEARKLFAELGWARAAKTTLQSAPRIATAVREAWRMKKRWPWNPPAAFWRRSLEDLRREFRIRVI